MWREFNLLKLSYLAEIDKRFTEYLLQLLQKYFANSLQKHNVSITIAGINLQVNYQT